MSTGLSLESVKAEIDNLASQVLRNSKAVADTGRRMLNFESTGTGAGATAKSGSSRNYADSDDEDDDGARGISSAVANEDLVQLVTELQTQLDILDERSIRRTANAFATQDGDLVAALPGNDGFIPGESLAPKSAAATSVTDKDEDESSLPKTPFPRSVLEFKLLPRNEVEAWLRYYELLPPEEAELHSILSKATPSTGAAAGKDYLSEEDATRHADLLARFLGLRIRKGKAVW